ncbi:helix-hairpin-helix domain-containing protein [Dyadobacter sp. CY261]|uniref:ComEA family DNA-binding protein n=1 Tax=Dyadobacter sp. CY261 TaxID=2907203 RepID=UPI001F23E6AE|nr:helix-hairpin-helix domain-containing protein [Dyadobacter sp. CY261]MCF0072619.1 helix-hairpin-helix domain-containing protein [Dyadobacter sp. CY261]
MKITYAFDLQGKPNGFSLCMTVLLVSMATFGLAQEAPRDAPPRSEIDINLFLAELFPVPPDDSEELFEGLLQLYASPLDLNAATPDDLAATFILSEIQLRSFFEYRTIAGALLSLYELQAVPGFDLATIRRLLPFVTISTKAVAIRDALKNPGQHFVMFRSGKLIERQKGFAPLDANSSSATRYQGPAFNGYLRYRNARSGVYSFGLTFEKDSGEEIWDWNARGQIFGFDYTSFHAQVINRGKLKTLIAGDFQMQTGQGMILGAGFSLGKGSEVIKTVYKSTTGLKPYTSATEANFFRGIAASWSIAKSTEVTFLFSRTKRDATQESDSITTSLPITGYHRTPSEIEKHNVLSEQNAGLHLLHRLSSQKGQIGFTMLHTSYDSFIQKRNWAYNRYEFSGTQNLIAGLHGDYRWQNIHFFTETAISKSGGTGTIGGLVASVGRKFDISMMARHYARRFHTFYGNPISEGTRPINENGAYAGLRWSPSRKWQWSAYFDYFRFPWLKFQVDAPSQGFDYFLHWLWKPSRRLNAYLLFHEKHKQLNDPSAEDSDPTLIRSIKRTATFNMDYEIPLKCALRTRFQYGSLKSKGSKTSNGFTVAQDVTCYFSKLEISGRVAFFKTDDYDSRQYAYEKDMLYAFSIPAYYNAGTRHYLMLRYTLSKHIKIWLRWSQTRYSDIDKISSGLNEIDGNKRSEAKVQVMYQF